MNAVEPPVSGVSEVPQLSLIILMLFCPFHTYAANELGFSKGTLATF